MQLHTLPRDQISQRNLPRPLAVRMGEVEVEEIVIGLEALLVGYVCCRMPWPGFGSQSCSARILTLCRLESSMLTTAMFVEWTVQGKRVVQMPHTDESVLCAGMGEAKKRGKEANLYKSAIVWPLSRLCTPHSIFFAILTLPLTANNRLSVSTQADTFMSRNSLT